MLYHYTSLAALQNILQENGLVFWLSRYSDMEDNLEVKYAIKLMRENGLLNDSEKEIFEEVYPYILSLCGSSENYPLWRLYAEGGRGVSLGIDSEFQVICPNGATNPTPAILQKVLYKNDETLEKLNNFKNILESDNLYYPELLASLVKHPSYSFEDETRIILINHAMFSMSYDKDNNGVKFGEEHEDETEMMFRYNGSTLVRYKEVIIPKEYLKSITIGFNAANDTREKIQALLKQRGYGDVAVGFCKLKEDQEKN